MLVKTEDYIELIPISIAGLRLRQRGDGSGCAEEGGVPAEGRLGRQGRLQGWAQP